MTKNQEVKVTPGNTPLTAPQKTGLELVSILHPGRDVVLAIDLTESVGFNDEGRALLHQIVKDSLKPGDLVYIIPFGSDVGLPPGHTLSNPLGTPVKFTNDLSASTEKILEQINFKSDPTLANTDIQRAELTIYQGLAQINQNRLQQNQPIKPQSVVWVTDAPIGKSAGIDSQTWIETPAQSPFRIADSLESKQREAWIQALPIHKRSRKIENFQLSVVDIAPTVQEFCTPAPGRTNTCLVTTYVIRQLWLPGLVSIGVLLLTLFGVFKALKLQRKWELVVDFEVTEKPEDQKCRLPHNKRIAIGATEHNSQCIDSIDCPGSEVRGYLERQGENLFLIPTHTAPIYLNGKEISAKTLISSLRFRMNCPDTKNRDYEIVIKIKK
ncbi:vWA domain-containing protein [Calothrix sp. NIES-3974]|uniref:vWA domain-containing protein n=1 Tax=Calothrix sp. NIES-3974 TaxID=2005462 RepID=UPI000B5DF831|nr:vWA domain-containing protein [Calothrix sp. NIES-3974]BAZ05708.1 hypothetical protein NIES3974_23620 [Calothrix sp. NIES-3974]